MLTPTSPSPNPSHSLLTCARPARSSTSTRRCCGSPVASKEVLRESRGLWELGDPSWWMLLCLGVIWLVNFLCLFKGIKTSGKVVYFTATFPYLILLILLIMSVTLPGAGNGIHYLFVPNAGTWHKLADFQVLKSFHFFLDKTQVLALINLLPRCGEKLLARYSSPLASPGAASLCLAATTGPSWLWRP